MSSRFHRIVRGITPPLLYGGMKTIRDTIQGQRVPSAAASPSCEPYNHRAVVGGLWDELGELQYQFLLGNGLRPDHKLLDVGCGSLRGGVRFIEYLDPGNYYGIDGDEHVLEAGRTIELPRYGVAEKTIHLAQNSQFEFTVFDEHFDYALAQSLFTHLPWNSILRCLVNVERVLEAHGKFFATFFEDPDGTHLISTIQHTPGGIITYPDRDPYHYKFDVFIELGKRASLHVEYIGPWNHPRGQMMMLFKKA